MLRRILLLFLMISSISLCASKEELKKRIESILTRVPHETISAIIVLNPQTQDTIYSDNISDTVIPASNTKLFTTATALNLMGGDFPLSTKILSVSPLRNGVLNGNLYIKGYGNSLFTENDLIEMVKELKNKGVKKITGKIIGDDSYFDEDYSRDDWINDELTNYRLPPVSALVLDHNRTAVKERIRVRVARRRYRIKYVTVFKDVSNPPLFVAQALRAELIKNGIRVDGVAEKGITPNDADVLAESTIKLKDLIKVMDKHSDNFLAECLFKTIGAVSTGEQGNAFYSTQAVMRFIKDNGIFSKGTSLVDGSGLSRYDLVTVGAIAGVLEKMYFDRKNYKDFYNALSVAGVDGTLRYRMAGTPAENNFHGKTGTLNGVSSLSGYLKLANGNDLIISIVFQYRNQGAYYYREIENAIVTSLSEWK
ncbi:MAG TPA: D-alanyl-D-alanine carboxypeptidase/D-alanyl-D-alanine-endopeptidase [Ignavibacteriaceae bacterium]|nr:D-alanyl-D-alanine carboxypeptidase/D-alanyl-D-alanine-endopeptidase [Ignavibacteriaceae bacterium]